MNEPTKRPAEGAVSAERGTVRTRECEEPGIRQTSVATSNESRGGEDNLRHSTPGRRSRWASWLTRVVILACTILAVLTAADEFLNAGKIRHGVSVGDVALGGKTPAEARTILEGRHLDGSGRLRVSGPTGTLAVPAGDLGVRLDGQSTVEKAYAVGRKGSFPRRLSERARSLFGVVVTAEVRLQPGAAGTTAEDLAHRVNGEAKDASVDVSGSSVRVTEAELGYRLDVPATTRNIVQAAEDLSFRARASGRVLRPEITTGEAETAAQKARRAVSEPLVLMAAGKRWQISPDEVGSSLTVVRQDGTVEIGLDRDTLRRRMSDVYSDLTVKPVEAGYEVKGGADPTISVTPGHKGTRIEEDRLFDAIQKGVFEREHEYTVETVTEEPDLTTAEAEKLKPTDLLGSYRTNYAIVQDSSMRVDNLAISSNAVNGTLLAPGEVFSMNSEVSHLDYEQTKVIMAGQETTADGGGLCQVTSTLYNAANFAGLDVIERTPHSSQLPYIRPGMDATVWWGGPGKADDLDMKFRNTTDGYLLLRERVARDGYVYAEIWGRPNGTEVTMNSEPVYMGQEGSEWVTHQKIEKDGKVIFDGVLHRDSYESLVDEHGNAIPTSGVPVSPVDP